MNNELDQLIPSQFGCFDPNENVIQMEQRSYYENDLFGLKSLDRENKIVRFTVPGIRHIEWHKDFNIMDNYIIPYLED